MGLGEAAIGGFDRLEIRIAFQLKNVQRAHLVAASAAVAGASPAIMPRLLETLGIAPLASLAGGRFLGRQTLEIVPVAIVIGGMALAEIPAVGFVGDRKRTRLNSSH